MWPHDWMEKIVKVIHFTSSCRVMRCLLKMKQRSIKAIDQLGLGICRFFMLWEMVILVNEKIVNISLLIHHLFGCIDFNFIHDLFKIFMWTIFVLIFFDKFFSVFFLNIFFLFFKKNILLFFSFFFLNKIPSWPNIPSKMQWNWNRQRKTGWRFNKKQRKC